MEELSILELQSRMKGGMLTATELAAWYLERIDALDGNGPALNSVIEINPDAIEIAAVLDNERQVKGPRGPLHGIPILLKDNIDTADRMATSAGSLALATRAASSDAHLVRGLREAGAVILGKTNLSEWANFRSTRSTSGWSSRGGQTKNPYALDRNPCGSSSGSAVAVAANLCTAAVGTETDGSIVCPASANGIVGFKPTVGLVSRSGIIPISQSQDTAGPMTRSVTDAVLMLQALCGADPRDLATMSEAHSAARRNAMNWLHGFRADYAQFLDAGGLRGARIGVARNFFGFHPAVDEIMERSLDVMRQLGAELIDPAPVTTAKHLEEPEFQALLHEFKDGLNAYLGSMSADARVHSLQEVIDFNDSHRETVMPYFGQEIFLLAQEKEDLSAAAYQKVREECRRLAQAEGIDAVVLQYGLDALVAPSGGPAWLTDLLNGDHYTGGGTSSPAAVAGYPHITVPAGYVFGLPVGISFLGRAYQEPTLIRLAYAFEQATRYRRPPSYLPTANPAT